MIGAEPAGGGPQLEAATPRRFEGKDLDSLAHGGREGVHVARQGGDDLVARHIAVRIVPVVRVARELDGPVRGHQAEAVPAIPPCLADPAPPEHDMLDARVRELMADGQACLSASDDGRLDVLHGAAKCSGAS